MSQLLAPQLLPWVCFLLPFLLSWLLTASLLRLAPRLGLVDHPNARKIHKQCTPSGGGLAIYLAMVLSSACLPYEGESDALRILAFGMVIVLLGLIDDLRPLPWQLRLSGADGHGPCRGFHPAPGLSLDDARRPRSFGSSA